MVEFLSGKRELISFGKESTYGTAVTPTVLLNNNTEFEPRKETDYQEVSGTGSDSLTPQYEAGNKIVGGTLRFVPRNWKFLTFCIGTTTNSGSSPTTHTFSRLSDKSLPSFTLERAIQHSTDSVRTFEGCQVNTWSLSWRNTSVAGGRDNFVNLEADLLIEDVNEGSSTTSLSGPSTNGFQARNIILQLEGVDKTKLLSGSVNVNNRLHDGRYSYYSSSATSLKKESVPQKITASGQFVLHSTDSTEFDYWDGRSALSGTNKITIQRGTDDDLVGTFSNIFAQANTFPTNLDGLNRTTINWIAEDISWVARDSVTDYIT